MNTLTLLGYEMRKLWRRPILWTAILVTALFFCGTQVRDTLAEGAIFSARYADPDGTVRTGRFSQRDRFRLRVEGARALAGEPMDEAFFARARQEIPRTGDRDVLESWFCLEGSAWWECYRNWSEWLENPAEDFYAAREEGVRRSLERESPGDTAYWMALEERVEKPFRWQPTTGIVSLYHALGNSGLALVIPLLCGIGECDLFSQERRHRMEPVLFSSRRGRSGLFRAKLLSGACTGALLVALTAIPIVLTNLAVYGTWGWNAALQLHTWSWTSSLPITLGQGLLLLLGLLLLYAFLSGALVSLVSLVSGNTVAALAAAVALMLLATRQFPSLPWAILLPCNLVDQTVLNSHALFSLLGIRLTALQFGAILYLLLGLVLWAVCALLWRRRSTRAARNG